MRLIELLKVIGYTRLEEHVTLCVHDKYYNEELDDREFIDIEVTPRNIATFGMCKVSDISESNHMIEIMIEK